MEDMANETHLLLPTNKRMKPQIRNNRKKVVKSNNIIIKKEEQELREEEEEEEEADVIVVDEKEEVENKIEALQRIVPGGESLGVDKLFEETAGYIMALQCQLKAMKALANFFESLEKENRMFGG